MRRLFLVTGLILFAGFVFGQNNQQNLLQGSWLKSESKGLNEYRTSFVFTGNKVNVAWDGDAYGEFNFVYTNNIIKIYRSNSNDPFLELYCFISGDNMVLLWNNGWAILKKE